jgi:hypothetical protein
VSKNSKSDSRTKQQLRTRIAAAAARLIAEDGLLDYSLAKRKAARQLGMDNLRALPDNDEVEQALRVHQSLYQGDEQPEHLRYLREEALKAMQLLSGFRPYLRGSVLKGTAGRYSSIELQLFVDDSKELELYLLNRDIPYEVTQERGIPVFTLDWDGTALNLAVHPFKDERIATSASGRPLERASLAALQLLLAAEDQAPQIDGDQPTTQGRQ